MCFHSMGLEFIRKMCPEDVSVIGSNAPVPFVSIHSVTVPVSRCAVSKPFLRFTMSFRNDATFARTLSKSRKTAMPLDDRAVGGQRRAYASTPQLACATACLCAN
jgi:hypothetical protein